MESYSRYRLSNTVTKWFHKRGAEAMSPAVVVSMVHATFINMCRSRKLNIAVSYDQLKESLSEATCVMYAAKITIKDWQGPKREFPYPSNWTNELEELWSDCLEKYIFTDDYWNLFWAGMKCEVIQNEIPYWKEDIATILPLYVMREMSVLVDKGLIIEPSKATPVYDDVSKSVVMDFDQSNETDYY